MRGLGFWFLVVAVGCFVLGTWFADAKSSSAKDRKDVAQGIGKGVLVILLIFAFNAAVAGVIFLLFKTFSD